ncbi:hypothetical protein PVK06_035311 [Gossypium arboreum]|uniref:Uncharacterized protein n=1 Tax=Gossypium arboreum TaxID=29729 RepID=A0ABR0NGH0_GOSAR|nr:hypothetical protein PVK06_035311 [Gossypium arboreum]
MALGLGKMSYRFFSVRHFPENLPPISPILLYPFFISFSFFMQALYANTSISTGTKGATKAMVAMNKIKMMSEAIDETLDKDEAEKKMEELTNQLSSTPKGQIASKNAAPLVNVKSEPTTDVDDLEKRLPSL